MHMHFICGHYGQKSFSPSPFLFFPQESLWVCLIGIQFKATNNSLTVFFQGPGRCCTSAAQQQQQWAGMTAVTYNCVMRTFVNGWYGGSKNTRHGYVWNNVAQVASISRRSKEVSFSHQYLSRTESQEWQSVQSKVNIRSGVYDKQKYEKQWNAVIVICDKNTMMLYYLKVHTCKISQVASTPTHVNIRASGNCDGSERADMKKGSS